MAKINPEDIKVTVVYTDGYEDRFTKACVEAFERMERKREAKEMQAG